jgi:hypothetical protein
MQSVKRERPKSIRRETREQLPMHVAGKPVKNIDDLRVAGALKNDEAVDEFLRLIQDAKTYS